MPHDFRPEPEKLTSDIGTDRVTRNKYGNGPVTLIEDDVIQYINLMCNLSL